MNYWFHPDAFDEHHDSVAFYQNRLPGLGADYIVEFEELVGCNNQRALHLKPSSMRRITLSLMRPTDL